MVETVESLTKRIQVVKKGAANCRKQGMKSTAKMMDAKVKQMQAELAELKRKG